MNDIDLKPENIMYRTKDPNSELVIIDLGYYTDINNIEFPR